MSIISRRVVVKILGLAAAVTVVFATSIFLFQQQSAVDLQSRASRPFLLTQPKLNSPLSLAKFNCSGIAKVLAENLTSVQTKLTEYEGEITRLHLINKQLDRKLKDAPRVHTSQLKNSNYHHNASDDIPTIFMITPTYSRWTQKADLTRLCQTLMHVKNIHWIVVEDADKKTELVTNFLHSCPVSSTQLNFRTSRKFRPSLRRHKRRKPKARKSRGVEQRNLALLWLRNTFKPGEKKGVLYFGDDDNTYDLKVFEEMRYINKVGVWPVGIAGGLRFEGPVCKDGKVIAWHAAWGNERKFQIDFAGLAVNLDTFLEHKTLAVSTSSKSGYLENDFLSQLVSSKYELEAKADNCMKVLVWHTQTKEPLMSWELALIKNKTQSDPRVQ